ncbi:MAG: PorT family protein [Prolixibacteraceae bacterium]|jgi:hypothetical protein
MKKVIFSLIAAAVFSLNLKAQVASADELAFTKTSEKILSSDTIEASTDQDTAIVRIGKKDVKVIDHDGGTEFVWGNGKHRKNRSGKFTGHWEGFEIGFNGFDKADYSLYGGNDFMSLNQGKSLEVDLNSFQMNIGLIKSYVGLVSGLGLSMNNYRFENPYTLQKGQNMTEPLLLEYDNLSKSKLLTTYLNVPLLLEIQIPVNDHDGRLFVSGGVIGGVKIGSHTKVKYGDTKDKDRSGFNINSFKYEATARVGYKDFCLFAKYSLTPLFEAGKGPDLTPFTVGISLLN